MSRPEHSRREGPGRRFHDQWARKAVVAALVCWAVVSTAGFAALLLQELADHQAIKQAQAAAVAANRAVRVAVMAQYELCHRLNVHRNADNINAYASWNNNVLFAFALAHPLRGQPHQSREQKRLVAHFLKLLQVDVSSATWTPLTTDCRRPGDGRAPVRFVVRQPKPEKDLVVKPGE